MTVIERSLEEELHEMKGFVGLHEHTGDAPMIWLDKANKQGYLDRSKLKGKQKHYKNLIVSKASTLIAKRMRPGVSWGAGISHLELGTGVGTGTPQAPQIEAITQTALRVPLARKAIGAWTYIDPATGLVTASETNIIEFTVTFLEAEANGAIVEMGLFGGDATTTLGTGYMFNYKVFAVWNKQDGMQLSVTWRITF